MTAALEAFLNDFKASPEDSLAHAIGSVTIDEDDISDDDYDFMEEDHEARERGRQQRKAHREPYPKYKEIMQELADRKIDEVMIDLDDLSNVRICVDANAARDGTGGGPWKPAPEQS